MAVLNLRLTLKEGERERIAQCELEVAPAQTRDVDTIFAYVAGGAIVKVDIEYDQIEGLIVALRPHRAVPA